MLLQHGDSETDYKDEVNNTSEEIPQLLLLIPSLHLLLELYHLQEPFIEVTYRA